MSDQNEFALYPRFGKLNCLNLLHLQQHLYDLERKLEELDIEELSLMENKEVWGESSPEDTVTGIGMDKSRQHSGSSEMSKLSRRSIGFGGLSAQEKADRQAMGCEDGQCHILKLPAPFSAEQSGKKLPLSLRRCRLMGEVSKTLRAYSEWLFSCIWPQPRLLTLFCSLRIKIVPFCHIPKLSPSPMPPTATCARSKTGSSVRKTPSYKTRTAFDSSPRAPPT